MNLTLLLLSELDWLRMYGGIGCVLSMDYGPGFEYIQTMRPLQRDYAQCVCTFFQTDILQNEDGYELHLLYELQSYIHVCTYILYSSRLMKGGVLMTSTNML